MIRKAQMGDVKEIQKLLTNFANRGDMLSRSLSELYESLRDFYVSVEGDKLLGTAALHIVWDNLAEVRSVAVSEDAGRKGIGSLLLAHARALSPEGLWLYTLQVNLNARTFYEKHGFKIAELGISPPPESEPDIKYIWKPK